jgi:hypothetical protein
MLGSRPGHLSLLPWNNLYAKLGFKVGDLTQEIQEKCGNKMKENMERNEEKPSLTNNFIIIIHIFYQHKVRLFKYLMYHG